MCVCLVLCCLCFFIFCFSYAACQMLEQLETHENSGISEMAAAMISSFFSGDSDEVSKAVSSRRRSVGCFCIFAVALPFCIQFLCAISGNAWNQCVLYSEVCAVLLSNFVTDFLSDLACLAVYTWPSCRLQGFHFANQ